jgi:uncharacterized protein (TIGR02300 family)
MANPELGDKCTCAGCGGRFYDMNRSPGMCPKCGTEQPPEKPRVARPQRSAFASKRPYQDPVPVFAADEAEPASVPDAEDLDEEDGDVVPEPDEDGDDGEEIGPVHHEVAA